MGIGKRYRNNEFPKLRTLIKGYLMGNAHNAFIPTVKKLPWNSLGRDFVVGDIHGCLPDLLDLLDRVSFDKKVDRLLSVGDLVDRGPDSWGVLALLAEPWFFAVKGNHEDLLLDHIRKESIAPKYSPVDFIRNGGSWYYSQKCPDGYDRERIFSLLEKLPHIIVVSGTSNRFNVVHGELLSFKKGQPTLFGDPDIDRWEFCLESGSSLEESDLIWERTIFTGQGLQLPDRREYLSPTFCGHSIVEKITIRNNHINLDTGAFKRYLDNGKSSSGRLSMIYANVPSQ